MKITCTKFLNFFSSYIRYIHNDPIYIAYVLTTKSCSSRYFGPLNQLCDSGHERAKATAQRVVAVGSGRGELCVQIIDSRSVWLSSS
jgi:hypothetical protein